MKIKKCLGKLIAIDMYNCTANYITAPATAQELLESSCQKHNLALVQTYIHQEDNSSEYILTAICHQGHVALHIYPELGFMAADIFSCYSEADPAALARTLRTVFDADKSKITLVDRGDFGSESDMKPKYGSKTTFIRRTKNLGGKLKKMIFLRNRSI